MSELKPCPFCGGEAGVLEFYDVEPDDVNFGGSCICCRQCGANSPVHFDRKENLYASWNDRIELRCSADSELRKALEAAYLELKKHDADYHYRTPVAVNSMIVDALRAEPQTASTDLLKRARQFVADSGCDEDNEVNAARDELLTEIDAALARCQAESASVREVELEEALKNLMGIYDTPVSRRRYPQDQFMKEALDIARAALTRPLLSPTDKANESQS